MKAKRWFEFRSIRTKLLASFLAMGLLPIVVVGVLAYRRSSASLIEAQGRALQLSAQGAIDKIERNLFERYGDVQAFALNALAKSNVDDLTWAANSFTRLYGIYDLMVIADSSGTVIAVNHLDKDEKPVDTSWLLGQSVRGQDWFDKAIAGDVKFGQSYYTDLQEDPWVARVTGGRGLSMNFTAPIFDEQGHPVRVWSNRASWERIGGEIMSRLLEDMKAQGAKAPEAQVVSRDGLILWDPEPGAILSLNLVSAGLEAARNAAAGKTGYTTEPHKRRKVEQMIGYAPSPQALGFKGNGWGVLTRLDAEEATAPARALRNFTAMVGLAVALCIVVTALWIARGITRPMQRTVAVLQKVAEGDLEQHLDVVSRDEIGQMAAAVNRAVGEMRGALLGIGEQALSVASSSEELTNVSQQMAANAEETSAQAGVVAAGAEQVSKSLQTVAAGTEEMSASIKEIAKNATEAAAVASSAVRAAEATNATVAKLGESSAEIGQVIKVITSIAQQTNLLALNATIEAARAGEAGKGFAVVANEVKELAAQTAKATEDISQKIETIQADSQGAVAAIAEIGGIIKQIDDIANTIASAVEEQSATTNEMSRNVAEAAKGGGEIASNIEGVAQAAQGAAVAANDTQLAAGELARMGARLQELVAHFKVGGGETRSEAGPAASTADPAARLRESEHQPGAPARASAPDLGTAAPASSLARSSHPSAAERAGVRGHAPGGSGHEPARAA